MSEKMMNRGDLTPQDIEAINECIIKAASKLADLILRIQKWVKAGEDPAIIVSMVAAECIENVRPHPERLGIMSYMLALMAVGQAKEASETIANATEIMEKMR